MKKLTILGIMSFVLLFTNLFADERPISAEALPNNAKTFLKKYFKDVGIAFVEQDHDSYEVYLEDGIEIEFRRNGDWQKVEGKYNRIPTGFIPKKVISSIKSRFPNASIVSIDKDFGGFDIELDNRIEVKIGSNGNIYEIDRD